jgi:aromatic ring-opening dioxygenase catalytic subunit (LigB family)
MPDNANRLTRRGAIAAGLAGVAGLAAANRGSASDPKNEGNRMTTASTTRVPTVYLPHGGGPWPFVDMGFPAPDEKQALIGYLRSVQSVPKTPPKALLVVSAHWEEKVPTVMTAARPPILYDYYGFPPESYAITWPAPGDPVLASRVQSLLGAAGFESGTDAKRGYDHGTFVPLKLTYPEANVPTVQLSLKAGLDPEEHLAIGRAIAPLRDEGVFIVGSGMSYHNMRGFGGAGGARAVSESFDGWLREAAVLDSPARDKALAAWSQAPSARAAHPREEHLLPLMVVAGAAGADKGTVAYNGTVMGVRVSAVQYG